MLMTRQLLQLSLLPFPMVRIILVEVSKISTWLKANKLLINESKSKLIVFRARQRSFLPPVIRINGVTMEEVDKFNYLGIVIDQHLTWNAHVRALSSKICKVIGILNRLKNFVPRSVLKTIYNSLIHSKLQYGILVWGHGSDSIFKLQKKAVRVMTKSKFFAHTDPIFQTENILKFSDLRRLSELKFYYKLLHGSLPHYFRDFTSNFQFHGYPTRGRENLSFPHLWHEFARKSLCFTITETVNSSPHEIISKIHTHSLKSFALFINLFGA